MTLSWSKTRALAASLLLVIVTNAIALGGVAYNRGGEPRSALTLTQRELRISRSDWLDHANSGIDLELKWRVRDDDKLSNESYPGNRELHWLSEAQRESLGFAAPAWVSTGFAEGRHWDPPNRQAFVALENDGAAHRRAIEQARARLEHEIRLADANPGVTEFERRLVSARDRLGHEEKYASRLFVVDVDPDADALRARYPDRSRYAIVRADLGARLEREPLPFRTTVYIVKLDIATISVPHAFRAIVAPSLSTERRFPSDEQVPPFEADVEWGRRFEPSLTALRKL